MTNTFQIDDVNQPEKFLLKAHLLLLFLFYWKGFWRMHANDWLLGLR